jgi:retrograde regulation protein 2
VATEATRTAKNSDQFQKAIKNGTGLIVEMYPKAVEGLVGAYGVASSFETVRGLVMDLGGGSTQITWIISPDPSSKEQISMSDKFSVSMPYGAAAMTRRLKEANEKGEKARDKLKQEVITDLKAAVEEIKMPEELTNQARHDGLNLYLSGGGFRGWGYVLMSQHPVQPYPIPIINGFHVPADAFYDTDAVTAAVQTSIDDEDSKIFRVSSRRAAQVPAVAFLVTCLIEALPFIKNVFFCQGGVREGTLFRDLQPTIRTQDPLIVACRAHAPRSASALRDLLHAALPRDSIATTITTGATYRPHPPTATPHNTSLDAADIAAFAHCIFQHAHLPKDIRAAAALRSPSSGLFAATHGLSHFRRAALAVFLAERHGGRGELSPADVGAYDAMVALLEPRQAWWCLYLGRVAAVIAEVFPAGVVGAKTLEVGSWWSAVASGKTSPVELDGDGVALGDGSEGALSSDGAKGRGVSPAGGVGIGKGKWKAKLKETLVLRMRFYEREGGFLWTESMDKTIGGLAKAGKRKAWVGRERGFRLRIELERVDD